MLYTPLAWEDIWGPLLESSDEVLELVDAGGCQLLLRRHPDGSRRVERVLSTNPRHYLDARYQPGTFF